MFASIMIVDEIMTSLEKLAFSTRLFYIFNRGLQHIGVFRGATPENDVICTSHLSYHLQ